ncbi:MAG TPA: hypothetical protein VGH04_04960 [Gemmatimonadaceae bacterium]
MTTRRGAVCLALAAALGQLACHSSVAPSSSAPAPQARDLFISVGESFAARGGAAALRDFTPEVAPVDSGGECVVGRTSGSGATVVQAYFPSRTGVRTQMTINFDSSGRLVRVSDRWGVTRVPSTVGMTPAQRDNTLRAASLATRSMTVTLDYVLDQAFAMNRGGGRPTDAISAPVRDMERLRQLGPPVARIERVRRLCAV